MTKIIRLQLSTPSSSGFRCEAVTSHDHASAHGNAICEAAGDPATLIGLALAFARQGPLFDGTVPTLILERLGTHASHGNPACGMVLDWIDRHHKVEAEAVAAVQPVDQVPDEAAIIHHAAGQVQGEISNLGTVADIVEAGDIADFADIGGGIHICGIGSRSSRDFVLSERIVSHAVIEPTPNRTAKVDANDNLNPDPKRKAEPLPKGKAEPRLKPKSDPKPGPSLKSGLRRHKHRPIAEIISATMVKTNEEVSHG